MTILDESDDEEEETPLMELEPETTSADAITNSVVYEFWLVFEDSIMISIAIAVVATAKTSILGDLYWPLKIISIIKLCYADDDTEGLIPLVRLIACCTAYVILSTISIGVLQAFSELDQIDKKKYGVIYNLILNFLWALETGYLTRAAFIVVQEIRLMRDRHRQHQLNIQTRHLNNRRDIATSTGLLQEQIDIATSTGLLLEQSDPNTIVF